MRRGPRDPNAALYEDLYVCPRCRRPQTFAGECPRCREMADQELSPLLARAHLLRMRGQWADAAEECARVLERASGNATAHSLLGDLCLDQGKVDEARHWYQLAIELNPQGEADRARLARAEELLEARRQRAQWEAVIHGRAQPVATRMLVRESVQRILAISGAALCGMILVLATLVTVSEGGRDADPRPAALLPAPGRRTGTGMSADTGREKQIQARLSSLAPGGSLLHVVRCELDPPPHTARLRLWAPAHFRDRGSAAALRLLVLREGYRYAYHLRAADPELQVVRIQMVGPFTTDAANPENVWFFLGALRTASVVAEPDQVTPEELARIYEEVERPAWSAEFATP